MTAPIPDRPSPALSSSRVSRRRPAHLVLASLLGTALGCASPPPTVAPKGASASAPLPSAPLDASATMTAPTAPPVDAGTPVAEPASPFTVVAPIDLDQAGSAVYELEDVVLARSGGAIVELAAGAARPRPDLAAGLPVDPCKTVSGIVGRFPDAAFALVSWAGTRCGTMFGKHETYRWKGSAWSIVPSSPALSLMAYAGIAFSRGPGVVLCDMNAEGGGCAGRYTLLPHLAPGARSPVGRPITSTLGRPLFGFAPSGTAFAVGASDPLRKMAIERWLPGRAKAAVSALPLSDACKAVGIHVTSDTSIFLAASCPDDDEAHLFHFDGRAITPVPTPAKAPATAFTGEPGGTLWLATADPHGSEVWRRAPEGAWTRVPLPFEHIAGRPPTPFEPTYLVVRGDDVLGDLRERPPRPEARVRRAGRDAVTAPSAEEPRAMVALHDTFVSPNQFPGWPPPDVGEFTHDSFFAEFGPRELST